MTLTSLAIVFLLIGLGATVLGMEWKWMDIPSFGNFFFGLGLGLLIAGITLFAF